MAPSEMADEIRFHPVTAPNRFEADLAYASQWYPLESCWRHSVVCLYQAVVIHNLHFVLTFERLHAQLVQVVHFAAARRTRFHYAMQLHLLTVLCRAYTGNSNN